MTPEHLPSLEESRTQKVVEHLRYAESQRFGYFEGPTPREQILRNASPLFRVCKPTILDIVPIGNQETEETVTRGLAHYAQTNPGDHYWQVYKLNGRDEAAMQRQGQAIQAFIARNPAVPISFYRQKYYDYTITQVRLLGFADMLDAYMALHEGLIDQDFTLLSDDIDFQGGTSGFMETLHRTRTEQDAHVVQPHLRHLPDRRLPQMSRVMMVFDELRCAFPYRLTGMRAIGLDDYLEENGFDPSIRSGGENELITRMIQRRQASFRHVYCQELTAYTSPRHGFHKLQLGLSPEDNLDSLALLQGESFGVHSVYREADYLKGLKDISPEQADRHVLDMLAPRSSFYGRRAIDAVIWSIMRPMLEHPERLLPLNWWPYTDFEREVLFEARNQVREWSMVLLDAFPLQSVEYGKQWLHKKWEKTDHDLLEHLERPLAYQWDHPLLQQSILG